METNIAYTIAQAEIACAKAVWESPAFPLTAQAEAFGVMSETSFRVTILIRP
jgi:hypothetical protein